MNKKFKSEETKKFNTLKPSEIIQLAMDDLKAIEKKKKKYDIDMSHTYHEYDNGKCVVCLAGAVMAITFGVPDTQYLLPVDFTTKTSKRLFALNYFRCGAIDNALHEMGIKRPSGVPLHIGVTPYAINPKNFKRDMKYLVNTLKDHNL